MGCIYTYFTVFDDDENGGYVKNVFYKRRF